MGNRKGDYMPKWVIPLLILVALVFLYVARWDNGPSRIIDPTGAVMYKQDRWTGQAWLEGWAPDSDNPSSFHAVDIPVNRAGEPERAPAISLRDNLTLTWDIAAGCVFLWLLVAIILMRPVKQNNG
jgi:hypothetical protein